MSLKGRENVYTCRNCGGHTVTIDVDEGVTPFLLDCRASGREGDCDGIAQSACYPKGLRPPQIPAPAWEWYKPSPSEARKLNRAMKQHVRAGGLLIRARQ